MARLATDSWTPEKLRAAMDQAGLQTHNIAEQMGVSHRTVRLWKSGGRNIPAPVQIAFQVIFQPECSPLYGRLLWSEMYAILNALALARALMGPHPVINEAIEILGEKLEL